MENLVMSLVIPENRGDFMTPVTPIDTYGYLVNLVEIYREIEAILILGGRSDHRDIWAFPG
jgi:hypothetical protein